MTKQDKLEIMELILAVTSKGITSPKKRQALDSLGSNMLHRRSARKEFTPDPAKQAESAERARVAFEAAGFSDVRPHETIKTFFGWKAQGRHVIKGQHSPCRGLFHISQTEPTVAK